MAQYGKSPPGSLYDIEKYGTRIQMAQMSIWE